MAPGKQQHNNGYNTESYWEEFVYRFLLAGMGIQNPTGRNKYTESYWQEWVHRILLVGMGIQNPTGRNGYTESYW